MLFPLHPLDAYRADVALRPEGVSNRDDPKWIAIALATFRAGEGLRTDLTGVVAGLADWLSERGVDPGTVPLQAVQVEIEEMEEDGLLHLARTTCVSARRLADVPLIAGRLIAIEARLAWKAGDLNTAEALYGELRRAGRAASLAELGIRAAIGLGVVAQLRGNYPDVRTRARSALVSAERHGLAELAAIAHQLLMRAAVAGEDFSQAVIHGWLAFTNAAGDALREAEMLLNLSQLLHEIGRPSAAREGFLAVLDRSPPDRLRLPALGGWASAAVRLDRRDEVRDATRSLMDASSTSRLPYHVASALLEAWRAALEIDDNEIAEKTHTIASHLANTHGFHELRFRLAAERPNRMRRVTLASAAEEFVTGVEHLRGRTLVAHAS
ncbi:MAG: hypothetical protein ABJE47_12845 [bacterium]